MKKAERAGKGRRGCVPGLLVSLATVIGELILHRQTVQDTGALPDRVSLAAGHEVKDMRPSQVIKWLGLLVVGIVLLVAAITIFELLVVGHVGPIQAVVANPPNAAPPPAPQLETANGQVLEQLHAQEDQLLNHYTWINQGAGTLRIPIDRAIELTAQRGLPTRSQPAGQSQGGELTRPERSSSGRTLEKIP